jgi:hypothetical protein
VHKFDHGLDQIINPMFFVVFLALPKFETRAPMIHILTLDGPLVVDEG